MITAIPAVTKYINSSKKSTFADSAGAYINAARYSLLNDEYTCSTPAESGQTVKIPLSVIDIDKGTGKSSYGKDYKTESYVFVQWNGGKLDYSICLVDSNNNGTWSNSKCLVPEKDLGKNTISAKGATFADANASETCAKVS